MPIAGEAANILRAGEAAAVGRERGQPREQHERSLQWLHGSRAGLNVVRQEQGGGYFSNREERWSCGRYRQSCVLELSKGLLRFGGVGPRGWGPLIG